uniref:Uncharacterized protein n=1 Tax=Ditylenchus dipsaci TaxID=166011 RepID=A0A915CVP1_9BILA
MGWGDQAIVKQIESDDETVALGLIVQNNPRAFAADVYLQWIYEAWQSLTKEMIASSFETCGITNALDGSEDDSIHCFKQHGPASNGRILLQQAREDADVEMLPLKEIDEYEDQENGYESDVSIE